jgi:hypothetical protein
MCHNAILDGFYPALYQSIGSPSLAPIFRVLRSKIYIFAVPILLTMSRQPQYDEMRTDVLERIKDRDAVWIVVKHDKTISRVTMITGYQTKKIVSTPLFVSCISPRSINLSTSSLIAQFCGIGK